MYQAVIFDLDGTLVDSEPIWFEIYLRLLAKFDRVYTTEIHGQLLGRAALEWAAWNIKHFDLSITPEKLIEERDEIRDQVFATMKFQPLPGVAKLLADLKAAGFKLGVATTSRASFRDRALTDAGVRDYFDQLISGDDVAHHKPAPDIYLKACELLGAAPSECLAVEDGQAGVDSAVAAGLDVIGISAGRFSRELHGATRIINSFTKITVEDIQSMRPVSVRSDLK